MSENPVDPVHDDHGENPDGSHDQDAEPPTPTGAEPDYERSGAEHPDPTPGGDDTEI
jgi:hypothetical protein